MHFRATTAALLAAGVLLAGCSSGGGKGDAGTDVAKKSSVVGLGTAEQVATALAKEVSTMQTTVVYNKTTDPEHLLGTKDGYSSKIAFSDSRVPPAEVDGKADDAVERGGSIETFATPAEAHARADEIVAHAQGPAAEEYHFYVGGSLVRVSWVMGPSQAADYRQAAEDLN
ncbi:MULTISPECIES: hypothetical protein [unclassified Streptomyces]|uniref:hypothetical protein n=1 Tax=unclassified Streptomyces TaxID=2593676 RepID=UPI002E2D4364|nr:hypothetical protein [Streptomyces sp. NBC_00223]